VNNISYLKYKYHNLPLGEVFSLPVTALVSVYDPEDHIQGTLDALNISSIYDLATSRVFNSAVYLCAISTSKVFDDYNTYNQLPNDVVKKDLSFDIETICNENTDVLVGVDEKAKVYLEIRLGVKTIWDLAHWTPFLQAKQLLEENEELNQDELSHDPEIPDELVPKFNQYPVDSFSYSIYTMMPTEDSVSNLTEFSEPLDLANVDFSLKSLPLRVGGIIRFEQTWTSKGLALGDLLHSLPLAPGESTKIAVIDWTRQQGVKLTEDLSQAESLNNSLTQTRSLNEVTRAVASEAQRGFSQINSNATVSNTATSKTGLLGGTDTLINIGASAAAGATAGALGGGIAGGGIGSVAAGIGAIPGAFIGAGSGAIIGGVAGGATALAASEFGGTQNSSSTSELETVTVTSSNGERSITAEMAQNISDRTLQHASSSRNKKASIVQEVSQKEREEITTRVVSNYNHMHALTIQYFEVVQLFEEKTHAKVVDPCIYIPFNSIDGWNMKLVKKYKSTLIKYALNLNFLRSLIQDEDKVVIKLNLPNNTSEKLINTILADVSYQESLSNADRVSDNMQYTNIINPVMFDSSVSLTFMVRLRSVLRPPIPVPPIPVPPIPVPPIPVRAASAISPSYTTAEIAIHERRYIPDNPTEGGFDTDPIPPPKPDNDSDDSKKTKPDPKPKPKPKSTSHHSDKVIYNIFAEDIDGRILNLTNRVTDASTSSTTLSTGKVPLKSCVAIYVEISFIKGFSEKFFDEYLAFRKVATEDIFHESFGEHGTLVLNDGDNDIVLKVPCYFSKRNINREAKKITIKVFSVSYANTESWVINHLNDNTNHYTTKVFSSLNDSEYSAILSSYSLDGKALVELVDQKPKAISGNYLIFKLLSSKDSAHEAWLDNQIKEQSKSSSLVPIPTGGIFAEAIQGRANSAEKLDITRFWNWQDSPIPHSAPDIAPIQAGTRATNPNVQPSNFSQPMVNISNGNPLPNPQGMGTALTAVSSPNIFRDMSGIAHSAAIAQKALEEVRAASVATGGQASENLEKGINFTKELASQVIKMAGDYGQSLANAGFGAMTTGSNTTGGQTKPKGKPVESAFKNISNAGSLLNQAGVMDAAHALANEGKSNDVGNTPKNPAGSHVRDVMDTMLRGNRGFEEGIAANFAAYNPSTSPQNTSGQTVTDEPQPKFKIEKSVGLNAVNNKEDVLKVRDRLHELGFTWATVDTDNKPTEDMINVIKLFQAIVQGHATLVDNSGKDMNGVYGFLIPGKDTEKWLQAHNAPKWENMESSYNNDEGYIINPDSSPDETYCTSWLAETIRSAGDRYLELIGGELGSNVAINIHELNTYNGHSTGHTGHKTGLNADIRLPRNDGVDGADNSQNVGGGITWESPEYDRDATLKIVQALSEQPNLHRKKFFFNDPTQEFKDLGVKYYKDHDNHIHFRIRPPKIGLPVLIDGSIEL